MEEIPKTIEQDLAHLREEISDREGGVGSEKEAIRQHVGERIKKFVYSSSQATSSQSSQQNRQTGGQDQEEPSYSGPELKERVQNLVNKAFSSNLDDAIQEVVKTNNAALIDAFHDVLVDELYDTLIERKKVPEVK